jgi:large subunit ribosomal protein L9
MPTQLLLIKDVDHLGRSGAVVKVKPGFARNFLVPNGYAIPLDKKALRMQASLQEKRQEQASVDKKEAEELAVKLQGAAISTTVKVDHEGHMYGSVSAGDIAHLIQEQLGLTLDKKAIQLKHAIKTTGENMRISVKLKEDVKAELLLTINAEESEKA